MTDITSNYYQPRMAGGDRSAAPAEFLGYRWLLMSVTSTAGEAMSTIRQIATGLSSRTARASVEFRSDGTLVAFDGVNTLSGIYAAANSEAVFHPLGSTFAGYRGGDPEVLATRSAFWSIFTDPRADGDVARVTLSIKGAHLTISDGECSLVLERADLMSQAEAVRRTHPGQPGP